MIDDAEVEYRQAIQSWKDRISEQQKLGMRVFACAKKLDQAALELREAVEQLRDIGYKQSSLARDFELSDFAMMVINKRKIHRVSVKDNAAGETNELDSTEDVSPDHNEHDDDVQRTMSSEHAEHEA